MSVIILAGDYRSWNRAQGQPPFAVRRRRTNVSQLLTRETGSMEPSRIVLYTREGCCLCDEAVALLARYWIRPQLIDIDLNSELREKFTNCVPVLEIDGKVRFRGRINEVLLKRLLTEPLQ